MTTVELSSKTYLTTHERLLRGVAATKGLSRRRGLYHRAGFLIQIASAAFPAWELPNWGLRLVIALLLIGFPIALILAWAYDITPQGIQVTPITPRAHRRRNLILLIAAKGIVSAAAGFFLLPQVSAHKIDKSIAVLPFQNLSSDPENAFFGDGIQNDILTNLSKGKKAAWFRDSEGNLLGVGQTIR